MAYSPYPTEAEKKKLVAETGLKMNQINNYFVSFHRNERFFEVLTDTGEPPNAYKKEKAGAGWEKPG